MYHVTLRINGKTYMGIGRTRQEASENAQQLIAEKINSGIACVTRKFQRVESANR